MPENSSPKVFYYLVFLVVVATLFTLIQIMLPDSDTMHSSKISPPLNKEDIEDIVKKGYDSKEPHESIDTLRTPEAISLNEATQEETTQEIKKTTIPKSANDYFDSLWTSYKQDLLDVLPPGKSRTDVVIRYYKHPKDGTKISGLKTLKFYIHERPIDSVMLPYESNAVYYGDSVSKADLQLTVFNLIKSGFPIKKVSLSEYHDNWKAHAIEIGTDTTVMKLQVLSQEEISGL